MNRSLGNIDSRLGYFRPNFAIFPSHHGLFMLTQNGIYVIREAKLSYRLPSVYQRQIKCDTESFGQLMDCTPENTTHFVTLLVIEICLNNMIISFLCYHLSGIESKYRLFLPLPCEVPTRKRLMITLNIQQVRITNQIVVIERLTADFVTDFVKPSY